MIDEHDDGLRSSTRRARVVKVDDSRSQQRVDLKGMKNEKPKKIWHALPFGFTTNPPQDSDGMFDQMGSRSDRSVYFDAGHEKYRPKNTPSGCMAIFNQYGDIVRVFKNSADVVHQSNVNIRVGHGYNAGDSGNSGPASTAVDDKQSDDTQTISIALNGNSIVLTYADSSVKLESGKITLTSPYVLIKSDHVDLGDAGGLEVKRCDDSCAVKVFAV